MVSLAQSNLMLHTHNNNDINNNSTYTYAKTQADSNTKATQLFRYEHIY